MVVSESPGTTPALVEMWRNNLRKSQAQQTGQATARSVRPATMHFPFGGGGLPVVATACDPYTLEVPWPATIVSAHMWAGDAVGNPVAVTATVDVQLTQLLNFGASTPLYGTGTPPRLQADSIHDCDLTGWNTNLLGTDAIRARLTSFTGSATWVLLVIRITPSEVDLGVTTVVDSAGDTMVDSAGNIIVLRS